MPNDFVVPNYSFAVSIEGETISPFHKVRGMEDRLEYEAYQEGGENTYSHIFLKPASSVSKLELVRYLRSGSGHINIMAGERLSEPVYVGVTRPGGENGQQGEGYSMMFTDCFVVGHSFSDLDAQGSQIMEETIEIAYQQMFYLPGLNVTAT